MRKTRIPILAFVLALAACAGNAPRKEAKTQTAATDPHCVTETGSRIPGQCSPGTTISREQLERTGGPTLADSLARSTPSISRTRR